jgi:hypothetical protein
MSEIPIGVDEPVDTAKDPRPSPERVSNLAVRVLAGDIILPEFQRPFVWKRRQILDLLDSIFRNYPIGSMLVWESSQKLASKRNIADLTVKERSAKYPVNYLLDGQQRLSTICGVLHWQPGSPTSVWNVAFDLGTRKFIHVDHLDPLPVHQIPMRRLSKPSTFYSALTPLEGEALRATADLLFNRFTDYQVPVVTIGDMSIKDVAPVFERINSTGTRLTVFDLMRAATWSPDFDLGGNIDEILATLEPKRFAGTDPKVVLRALGAAAGNSFSVESIDNLRDKSVEDLRTATVTTKASAQRATDFLVTEVGVPRDEALPYANQFAVLCEIFRLVPKPDSTQLAEIRRWFWASTLSGHFGGWNTKQMGADTVAVRSWADGKTSEIDAGLTFPTSTVWRAKGFRSNSAVAKMVALMLAARKPVDLKNGQVIDTDKSLAWNNDKEFHHFFPQAYLKNVKKLSANESGLVANIVMLTSASNIIIRDQAPSDYLQDIIDADGRAILIDRLGKSLISEEALDAALADDYEAFLSLRAQLLHEVARTLVSTPGTTTPQEIESLSDEIEDSDASDDDTPDSDVS